MREFIPEIGMSVPLAPKAERKSQKKPPTASVASAKVPLAKKQGAALGAAFAPLNWVDHDRVHSYAHAIRRGIAEAQDRRDFEREAASDDDFLRGIGAATARQLLRRDMIGRI